MSDIKIKCTTNDLTLKTKTQFLPTGYLKPQGTLEVAQLGLVDVTPYEKVNIKSAVKPNIYCGTDEPTDTKQLWVKKDFEVNKLIITNQGTIINTLNLTFTGNFLVKSVLVGNKIYLLGGSLANSSTNLIQVFDTETETLTTLETTLPVKLSNASIVAIGTKIYLFGGVTGTTYHNTIYVFDTETETIETLTTTLPTNQTSASSAVVGTKIYLFGGDQEYNQKLNTIYVFDTETETIETLTTTLTIYKLISMAVVGTKIYLFGGRAFSNNSATNLIQVFDTETETIETLTTTLPIAKYGCVNVIVGTKVYLFGGQCSNSNYYKSIFLFDIETETIETLETNMPENNMNNFNALLLGNRIYMLANGTKKNYVYNLAVILNTNNLRIQTDTSNTFKLFNNNSFDIEIGVIDAYVGNAENIGEKVKIALHNGSSWSEIN